MKPGSVIILGGVEEKHDFEWFSHFCFISKCCHLVGKNLIVLPIIVAQARTNYSQDLEPLVNQ